MSDKQNPSHQKPMQHSIDEQTRSEAWVTPSSVSQNRVKARELRRKEVEALLAQKKLEE